jgi:hypothetical protein
MQKHLHAVFAPDVISKREEIALQFQNHHIPGRTKTIIAQDVFIPVSVGSSRRENSLASHM